MIPIVISVSLLARPGRRDDLVNAFGALCDAATDEPGTAVFAVHTVDGDPDRIVCYEVYRDRDGLAQHQRSAAVVVMVAALGELVAEPPAISYLTPVRVKGIPAIADI